MHVRIIADYGGPLAFFRTFALPEQSSLHSAGWRSRYLVGLITRRSLVRVQLPLPKKDEAGFTASSFSFLTQSVFPAVQHPSGVLEEKFPTVLYGWYRQSLYF